MKNIDLQKEVTKEVLTLIKEYKSKGIMPKWNKGFNGGQGFQPLRENSEPYKGFNAFYLSIITGAKGWVSPYFLTFNKAMEIYGYKKQEVNSKGFALRDGEKVARVGYCKLDRIALAKKITGKGVPVIYYQNLNIKGDEFTDENGVEWQSENKVIPMMKNYSVFNACQFDGLKELKPNFFPEIKEAKTTNERLPEIDNYFDSQEAKLRTSTSGAFFRPSEDTVFMPDWTIWNSSNEYYSVLAHEFVHSTGTKDRLNRDMKNKFGSPKYAFEELVAELGSLFSMMAFGIQHKASDNNIAYLDNWLNLLNDHDNAIFKACALASKSIEYMDKIANKEPVQVANAS